MTNQADIPIHRILRMTLWQQAKGFLLAILETFWQDEVPQWEEVEEKVKAFIADIEGHTCLG